MPNFNKMNIVIAGSFYTTKPTVPYRHLVRLKLRQMISDEINHKPVRVFEVKNTDFNVTKYMTEKEILDTFNRGFFKDMIREWSGLSYSAWLKKTKIEEVDPKGVVFD